MHSQIVRSYRSLANAVAVLRAAGYSRTRDRDKRMVWVNEHDKGAAVIRAIVSETYPCHTVLYVDQGGALAPIPAAA